MIRINLLEEARQPRKGKAAAKAAVGPGPGMAPAEGMFLILLIYIGILVVVLGGLGLWYFTMKSKIARLDKDIEEKKRRVAELKKVIELNDELNQKRDLLRRKIEVIADLKKQQAAPVRMLDKISENLAEYVWLENMQVNGSRVQLFGKAQTQYAVAKFLLNIQQSPYFANMTPGPVQGVDIQTFSVTFDFVMPQEGEAGAAAGPSGASGPAPSVPGAATTTSADPTPGSRAIASAATSSAR